MSLPKEIDYVSSNTTTLPVNTSSKSNVIHPSNVSSLSTETGGSVIFDLGQQDYLVPSSMYLRMKVKTTGAGNNAKMFQRGIPAYSVFEKLITSFQSVQVENITNYGRTASTLIDLKLNQAQKSGMAVAFGLTNKLEADDITLTTHLHGRLSDSNNADEYFVAVPLLCVLSLADKLVPLGDMPQCRIELEIANINKIFDNDTATSDANKLELFNMELCYDSVNFGQDFNLMSLADDNGDILIKSQGHQVSTQTADAIAGLQTLSFPQRLSSVKSILAWFEGKNSNAINQEYDSVDITKGAGSYQFQCGNKFFPDVELNTARNKAGVFMELSNAVNGTSHDILGGSMSISPQEFNRNDNSTTTQDEPAMFILGVNTERMSGVNQVLLTGQSTALTPISLNVRCDAAPTQATTCNMLTIFDAIIQINVPNRSATLKI
tara:strand:- start:388 stop:1692 length:1305 start_codon:yes stop_codon:yes gene_type:complete